MVAPKIAFTGRAMDDRWMTVKDVAEYLQLSTDQIYRLAQQGKIPASKVGVRWRFKREKIDEWVENSQPQPYSGSRQGCRGMQGNAP